MLKPTGRQRAGLHGFVGPPPGLGQRPTHFLAFGVLTEGMVPLVAVIRFEALAAGLAATSVLNHQD
jgi:hypothetical protein